MSKWLAVDRYVIRMDAISAVEKLLGTGGARVHCVGCNPIELSSKEDVSKLLDMIESTEVSSDFFRIPQQ